MFINRKMMGLATLVVGSVAIAGCDLKSFLPSSDSGTSTSASAAKSPREEFFSENGQANSVELVITDVQGDPAKAADYLRKKILRVAGGNSAAAKKKAREQTSANKEAAKQEAKAKYKRGEAETIYRRGEEQVIYRYNRVKSKYHGARVELASKGDGIFTFYAYPVTNLREFAKQVGVGTVSSVEGGSRTVTLRSTVPTPIPDYETERMKARQGADNVVTLNISNAHGDLAAVRAYLHLKATQLDPAINLQVVGPEAIGKGQYKVSIAPVGNLEDFAGRIQFGKVTDIDQNRRLVKVVAKLPDPLPTLLAANQGDGNRPTMSSSDEQPRPGESKIDWALRIIKADGRSKKKALNTLATIEPDPAEKERVATTLAATFDDAGRDLDRYLEAMTNWKTPELAQAIVEAMDDDNYNRSLEDYVDTLADMGMPKAIDKAAEVLKQKLLDDRGFHLDQFLDPLDKLGRQHVAIDALITRIKQGGTFGDKAAIEAITRYKTPEACQALVSQLANKFAGKDAAKALMQMGLVAEPIALQMLKNPVPGYRVAGANLLFQMGSPKGVDALGKAIHREDIPQIENHLKKVRRALVAKMKNPSAVGSTDSTTAGATTGGGPTADSFGGGFFLDE